MSTQKSFKINFNKTDCGSIYVFASVQLKMEKIQTTWLKRKRLHRIFIKEIKGRVGVLFHLAFF